MRGRSLGRSVALVASLLAASGATATPSTRKVIATPGQMIKLAEEMIRRGKSHHAETILDLLTHDPDSNIRNEARFRQALMLEAGGRNEAAAVLLRRILDEKPDATAVRFKLATMLQKMGHEDLALRELRALHRPTCRPMSRGSSTASRHPCRRPNRSVSSSRSRLRPIRTSTVRHARIRSGRSLATSRSTRDRRPSPAWAQRCAGSPRPGTSSTATLPWSPARTAKRTSIGTGTSTTSRSSCPSAPNYWPGGRG